MQEGEIVNVPSALLRRLRIVGAWVFLFTSWILLVSASISVLDAVSAVGLFDLNVLLDAGFGIYGLLGFAMASVAVLLASSVIDVSKRSLFQFFKLTQLISHAFLLSTFVSTAAFLLRKGY